MLVRQLLKIIPANVAQVLI